MFRKQTTRTVSIQTFPAIAPEIIGKAVGREPIGSRNKQVFFQEISLEDLELLRPFFLEEGIQKIKINDSLMGVKTIKIS